MYDGSLVVLTVHDVDVAIDNLGLAALVEGQARTFRLFSASHTAPPIPSTAQDSTEPITPVQVPHRVATYAPAGRSLYMPAYMAGVGTACKLLTRQPAGVVATTALLADSGEVEGIVAASRLTALRNACGSAAFLRLRPPASLVVFGSGAQARAHLLVLRALFPITRVCLQVRARTPRSAALEAEIAAAFPHVAFGVELGDADAVLTATGATAPLFPASALKAGASVLCVGSSAPHMCEVGADVLRRAGRVVVDSAEACLGESGEFVRAGVGREALVELGEVLANPEGVEWAEIAVFKSVGLGIQDLAIARQVFDCAKEMGLGTRVEGFA
jgi:ornithine cyclodeaminase